MIVAGTRHDSRVIDRLEVGWKPDGRNCFDTRHPTRCAPTKDILCFHWTAGSGRGDTVVRRMKKRRSKTTGDLLRIGVHLVVDPDGSIRQYADLAHSTIHVGWRDVYRRSVGVEVVGGPDKDFTAAQYDAIDYLIAWCCAWDGPELAIPLVAAPLRQMTKTEQRAFRGVQEHLHCPTTAKRDAGLRVMRRMARLAA